MLKLRVRFKSDTTNKREIYALGGQTLDNRGEIVAHYQEELFIVKSKLANRIGELVLDAIEHNEQVLIESV